MEAGPRRGEAGPGGEADHAQQLVVVARVHVHRDIEQRRARVGQQL